MGTMGSQGIARWQHYCLFDLHSATWKQEQEAGRRAGIDTKEKERSRWLSEPPIENIKDRAHACEIHDASLRER